MKKLVLFIGALLSVAAVSAEVPAEPVVKEVIVYRDKEVKFKPNGFVSLKLKYYGEMEEIDYEHDGITNKHSRTEIAGIINMTEKQMLEYRIRSYNDWNANDSDHKGWDFTETRLRWFYNHGKIKDTNINLTSRLHYIDNFDGLQEVQYEAQYEFADYIPSTENIKVTSFILSPRYAYFWQSNNDDYQNELAFTIYSNTKLPWNFNLALNFYWQQRYYGKTKEWGVDKKRDDENLTFDMELYLTNLTNLYTNGKHQIDFTLDSGFDDFTWSENRQVHKKIETVTAADGTKVEKVKREATDDHVDYKLYFRPGIQYTYNVTPMMKTFVLLEAEYSNFKYLNNSSVRDFRWEPMVTVGIRSAF